MLFGGDSRIEHEPGSGQVSFKRHKQDSNVHVVEDGNSRSTQCTSLFIEPVSWMLPLLEGTTEGKVNYSSIFGEMKIFLMKNFVV